MADKNQSSPMNRTLFDKKCITCGTWMKMTETKSKKGAFVITYFCPECGLSFTIDG